MAKVTIEMKWDGRAGDSLDADYLASHASKALVEAVRTPLRDLNPRVVVEAGSGGQGHYPVRG